MHTATSRWALLESLLLGSLRHMNFRCQQTFAASAVLGWSQNISEHILIIAWTQVLERWMIIVLHEKPRMTLRSNMRGNEVSPNQAQQDFSLTVDRIAGCDVNCPRSIATELRAIIRYSAVLAYCTYWSVRSNSVRKINADFHALVNELLQLASFALLISGILRWLFVSSSIAL